MKKTKFAFLSLILAFSFAITSFAAPAIDYIVKDVVDGKEYYFFFGSYNYEETPSEVGVTLNGTDYQLKLPSMIELPKSKRFALAISDVNNRLGNEFTVKPYARDEFGIKEEGTEQTVFKNNISAPHDYKAATASEVVSGFYANDWGNLQSATEYIYIETDSNATMGWTMDPIGVALLKIDLTKLTDCDINRKVVLNVKGLSITGTLDHMTFGSYMVDSDWNEVSEMAKTPGLFYKNYAYKKTPMDIVSVTSPALDFSIDISSAVFYAKKSGKTEAVIAIAPDNTESDNLSDANGTRYDTMFNFYVAGKNAPTITYYTEDKSGYEAELTSIKAGDEILRGLSEGKTDFNVYLPYGTESLPEVSVTYSPESALAEITQATMENKKATVSLTPKYGGEAKVYTVNYIISAERPGETHSLDIKSSVFSDFYSIDPNYNKTKTNDENAKYVYNKTSTSHNTVYNSWSGAINILTSVAYLKLDLTKLTNINRGQPVYLNIFGVLGSAELTLEKTDVELYSVDNSVWETISNEDISVGAGAVLDVNSVVNENNFINKVTVTRTADDLWATTGAASHRIDITQFVNYCLDNNLNNPTIAVRVKPLENSSPAMRFRFWNDQRTYITYTENDMSGYQADLTSIKVGDESLLILDESKTEFNVYLPYGTETLPMVSATATPDAASVSITQATLENKKATVSLTPEYGGEPKVYTVNFIISMERAGETRSLNYESPVFSDVYSIDPATDVTAPVAENIKRAGTDGFSVYEDNNNVPNNYKNSMAFIKLDLTELKNIEKGSPVILKLHGGLVADDETKNAQLEFYHVSSDLWTAFNNSEDLIPGVTAATDIDAVISGNTPVLVKTLEKVANYWAASGSLGDVEFDISSYVTYCLDNNITTPTLALRINPLDATKYQHRFRFWHNKSYLTYTEKDMLGYEYEIETVEINGKAPYQFDKEKLSYNYYIPYGTESYPIVTATALKGNVTVTQATKENPVSTIRVAPEYQTGESIEYVINFIEEKESAEEATLLACSNSGIVVDAYSLTPDYRVSNTDEQNASKVHHAANSDHSAIYCPWQNTTPHSVAYIKLDLTKLQDINKSQPVYFNMYGVLGSGEATPVKTDIELYSVADSVWETLSNENLSVGAATAMDVNSVVNEKNFINKVSVEQTDSFWTTNGIVLHGVDITHYVNYCLDNNIMNPTFAVRVKPIDGSSISMRFRFFTNATYQSNVTYYKNSVTE